MRRFPLSLSFLSLACCATLLIVCTSCGGPMHVFLTPTTTGLPVFRGLLDASTDVCTNTVASPHACQNLGYPSNVLGITIITANAPSYYNTSPQFLDAGGGGIMPMLPKRNGLFYCDPNSADCLLGKPNTNIPPRHLRILTAAVGYRYTNTLQDFGTRQACAYAVSDIIKLGLSNQNFKSVANVSDLVTYIKSQYTVTTFQTAPRLLQETSRFKM